MEPTTVFSQNPSGLPVVPPPICRIEGVEVSSNRMYLELISKRLLPNEMRAPSVEFAGRYDDAGDILPQ
jgi:hypothetical protein